MKQLDIYLLNVALILFWALVFTNINFKNKNIIFILIVSIQLFLILGLRSENVGSDVLGYLMHFDNITNYDYQTLSSLRHEIGYSVLTKTISLITTHHQVFLIIISIIIVFFIGYFIYKHSTIPFLSYFLYVTLGFYTFTFSGLRQAIAYSIILYSYKYIKEKKIIKFILVVLIASLFHNTAIIFILAYFIAYIRITPLYLIVYIFIFILVYLFKTDLMKFVTTNFYDQYLVYESGAFNVLVVTIIIVLSLLMFYNNTIKINKNSLINYNLVMFSLLLIVLSSTSSNVLRVANYYYYFIILLIPNVVNSFENKKQRMLAYFIIITLALLQYVYLTPTSHLDVVPYEFFWQN